MATHRGRHAGVRAVAAVVEQLEARRMLVNVNGAGFVDANANGTLDGNDSAFLPGMTVYDDVNFNGQLDAGEPQSTTSIASQGNWSLNLTPGKHLLRANMPAGYHLSSPSKGALWVDVRSGTLYFIRFGAWRTGRHGVNFYRDRNGNGTREADIDYFATGKAMWADLDDDGVMDPEEPGAAADWGGFASIHLRPGTYRLRFTKPDEWYFTSPWSGSMDQEFNSLTAQFPDYVGMTGQSVVTGFVYGDTNGDERYDNFESPMSNVLAFVDLTGNARLDPGEEWALSDSDGKFKFLMPFGANAVVYVRHPVGSIVTSRSLSTDMEYDWEHQMDAGVKPGARVVGHIYADLDGNGVRNGDEPFLPGRKVWVDLDDDGVMDFEEPSTQTGFSGQFVLNGREGTLRIRTLEGDGYTFGPSGTSFPLVQITGRNSAYAGEFGMLDVRPERARSGAFGFVFNDLDRNGRQDPGERGVPGQTVYADVNNNGALDAGERKAVSDTSGYYTITELSPNTTYIIRAVSQPGWESVYVGNNGGNSITFGASPAFGDRHVPVRQVDAESSPFIAQAWFDRETGHALNLRFGRDVQTTIGPYDLVIRNTTTGQFIKPGEDWELETLTEAGVMSVRLPLATRLADGSYELIVRRSAVTDISGAALAADYVLPFTVLAGDANGDGAVNIGDYLRIDRGWAREGTGFSNGDFNYDSVIDGADYFLIDQAYLNGQPAPLAAGGPVDGGGAGAAAPTLATSDAETDEKVEDTEDRVLAAQGDDVLS